MELLFKFPPSLPPFLTTRTWEVLTWTTSKEIIMPRAASRVRGGIICCGFSSMWALSMLIFWKKEAENHLTRPQLQFRVELAKTLVGEFSLHSLSVSEGRLTGGHWPVETSKGCCKRCLKHKRTKWCRMAYTACAKRICLECFPNHCKADLWKWHEIWISRSMYFAFKLSQFVLGKPAGII